MKRLRTVRLTEDEGTSLIEAVVAIGIMVVISLALLSTASALTLNTFANRTRAEATALGSRYVETARTLAYGDLKVLDDGTFGAPNNVDANGNPVQLCVLPCTLSGHQLPYLTHTSTVSYQGTSYTISQSVYGVDDPSDGVGVADTDADKTVDYKLVTVRVTWAKPKVGSYDVQTIVHNTDAIPDPVIAGVRVEVVDSTGDIITDPAGNFTASISGPGVSDTGITHEGVYQDLNLPDGTYSCVVTSTNYAVAGTASTYSKTVTGLSVNAVGNPVALCQTTWAPSATCASSSSTGSLTVTVTNAAGTPVQAATVRVTNSAGATLSPDGITDSSGVATFPALVAGFYGVTADSSALVVGSAAASGCVTAGQNLPLTASGTAVTVNAGGTTAFTPTIMNTGKAVTNFELQVTGPGAGGPTSKRDFTLASNASSVQAYTGAGLGVYTFQLYSVTTNKSGVPVLNLLNTMPTSAPPTGTDFTNTAGKTCSFTYTVAASVTASTVSCA